MENRIIRWAVPIGIAAVLLGRVLNRVLANYFGDSASTVALAVIISILFCIILSMIAMSQYLEAIKGFIMTIPIIVGGIGLYLDNMYLIGFSILLMFIIYPILKKMMPK